MANVFGTLAITSRGEVQARQTQLLGTAVVKWLFYNLSQTKREKLDSAEGG